MKKVIFLVFMSIIFVPNLFSQSDSICDIFPMKDGKVFYTNVIEVKNISASQLYNGAKLWIGKTFVSSKSVIDSDVENNSLILKGYIAIDENTNINITLTLQFKDGKYKYELTDITNEFSLRSVDITNTDPIEKMPFFVDCNNIKIANEYNEHILSLIYDLKKYQEQITNW